MIDIKVRKTLSGAANKYDSDNNLVEIWFELGNKYLVVSKSDNNTATIAFTFDQTVDDFVSKTSLTPVLSIPNLDPNDKRVDYPDSWITSFGRVFKYYLSYPVELEETLEQLFSASFDGGRINSNPTWNRYKASDNSSDHTHYFAEVELKYNQAFRLGSIQRGLDNISTGGELLESFYFYQTITDKYSGFSGMKLDSKQPVNYGGDELFLPGELYQSNHPDSAVYIGNTFTKEKALNLSGLIILDEEE